MSERARTYEEITADGAYRAYTGTLTDHELHEGIKAQRDALLRERNEARARIAALEAERDAARGEAGQLRDLLEEARWHVTVLRDEQGIASCSQCALDARIEAALAASGQQR